MIGLGVEIEESVGDVNGREGTVFEDASVEGSTFEDVFVVSTVDEVCQELSMLGRKYLWKRHACINIQQTHNQRCIIHMRVFCVKYTKIPPT